MSATQSITDYRKFKIIKGNRQVDQSHVKELVHSINTKGNLTPNMPIVVNSNFEIIDGQHRFEALKSLGMPIYYEVKDDLGIDAVRLINSHHRNWNWRDYADSYAALGNEHYKNFLKIWDGLTVSMGFTTVLAYTTANSVRISGTHTKHFRDGDFVMDNPEQVKKDLRQYANLAIASNHNTRNFAIAALRMMRRPKYTQNIMESRLGVHSEAISRCYYIDDYLVALERVYRGAA